MCLVCIGLLASIFPLRGGFWLARLSFLLFSSHYRSWHRLNDSNCPHLKFTSQPLILNSHDQEKNHVLSSKRPSWWRKLNKAAICLILYTEATPMCFFLIYWKHCPFWIHTAAFRELGQYLCTSVWVAQSTKDGAAMWKVFSNPSRMVFKALSSTASLFLCPSWNKIPASNFLCWQIGSKSLRTGEIETWLA